MTQESENSLREADLGQTTSGATPDVVDGVAIAKLYGEPLFKVPDGLYIPPDALEVFLESFEGPLDLLLYLIRKQKFDVMNVPMALVTEQYMGYVELIRKSNLELAAEYLVMAACLMQIKSRLLLPVTRADDDEEVEDPQAELARRLLEYEKMKLAAVELDRIPRNGRDFWRAFVLIEQTQNKILPDVSSEELARVWQEVLAQAQLRGNHTISRQELSVREFMSNILRRLGQSPIVEFRELFKTGCGIEVAIVNYLAILELAKDGLVRITQAVPFAPLYVARSEVLT
ncbi:MAG: segregation/condensation protein A [Sutterella sp.]|nr:segregation/condensation protein A [Sutterella sp.]